MTFQFESRQSVEGSDLDNNGGGILEIQNASGKNRRFANSEGIDWYKQNLFSISSERLDGSGVKFDLSDTVAFAAGVVVPSL